MEYAKFTPLPKTDEEIIEEQAKHTTRQNNIQKFVDDNNLIKVYPNPISNQFTVEINGDNNSYGFEILNSMGQVVSSGKITEKITINSSDLSQGIYFVKIKLGNNFVTKKFIKTKTI